MNHSPRKHEGSKARILAGCVLLSTACVPGRPVPLAAACLAVADTTIPRLDTVVVALTPAEGERFLARHLDSSVVRVDCAGSVRPEQATRWTVRLVASPSAGPATRITFLAPVTGGGPVIKVEQLRTSVDPRDALDFPRTGVLSPADVVLTGDAAAVDYARSRKDFTVVPVAWALTYVLLTPISASLAAPVPITDETRRSLVRDVVPGEVRAASPPFWWDSLPCVGTTRAFNPGSHGAPIVALDRSDPIARALVERLVALTLTQGGRRANAVVLSLPRLRPISCDAVTQWPSGSRIDPLVDLQTFVIVRRGVPTLQLDGDGMIRFNSAASP